MRQLMRLRRRAAARGLTLVELMVTIAVLAVLAAQAAPYMGDMVTNSRLRESGNLVLSESLIAQSAAINLNTVVRVSTSGSTVQVLDMTVPASPVVMRTRTLAYGVTAPTATVDFGSDGMPTPFGTSASINLSMATGTCSSDLRCPGLRVDAGGAIRLCGNHQSCS